MRRKCRNGKFEKWLSIFLAVSMLVLSVPQTVLPVEAKTGELSETEESFEEGTAQTPEVGEEPGEGTEEMPEAGEEPGEGSEETSEIDEEPGEGSEQTPEIDEEPEEGSEQTPEIDEEPEEGSEQTPEIDEEPGEGSEETPEDGVGSEEEPEEEENPEEPTIETVEEAVAWESAQLEENTVITVEYENYTLGFTIKKEVNDWYAVITSYTDKSDVSEYELIIPSDIAIDEAGTDKLPVREIAQEVFQKNMKITKLSFEEDSQLLKIQDFAFAECKNLACVEWADSIESIGVRAFSDDVLLGTQDKNGAAVDEPCLTLPDNLQELGSKAFLNCNNLVKVVVPSTVTTIPTIAMNTAGPFYECNNLSDIIIEEGMKVIPSHLFDGHIRPTETDEDGKLPYELTIKIPGSVITIETEAFLNQGSMTRFEVGDNSQLKTIKEYAFNNCTNLAYAELPNSITSIERFAFNNNLKLGTQDADGSAAEPAQIKLPNKLESLGTKAFQSCKSIEKVVVPATLTEITGTGSNTAGPFYLCDNLSDITIEEGMRVIPAYLFEGHIRPTDTDSAGELLYPLTFTIPDSVETIGKRAFYNQGSLEKLVFGEESRLTKIEEYAFCNCPNLTYMELPDSVTSIGIAAFYENVKLGTKDERGQTVASSQLKLPSRLGTLGSKAFQGCDGFTKVVVPSTLTKVPTATSMEAGPFYLCDNLSDITVEDGIRTIPAHLFEGHIRPTDINDAGELLYPMTFKIPDSVITIEESAFENQGSMTRCEIGENSKLVTIDDAAFAGCSNLTFIELPDIVTTIGDNAFYGDTLLGTRDKDDNAIETPKLVFSVQLLSLGDNAYKNCASLQSVEFEVNNFYTQTQKIGEGAFSGCTSLKEVKLGNKIKAIANKAFYGCTALEELEIPYGVTSIGTNAFYNCHELKALFIPSSVTSIKTTKSELAYCYEQGLKIYVEKGENAAVTFAQKCEFNTEIGIYSTKDEFPDNELRLQMLDQRFDKNLDTRLTLRELEKIVEVDFSNLNIADMTGTQLFTSLESLDCSNNEITALDTSTWTKLKTLNCADNRIADLDLSNNPLTYLNCENNCILVFDLSGVSTLEDVKLGKQAGILAITYEEAYSEYLLPLKEQYPAYNKSRISEVSDEDAKKPTEYGLIWYEAYDVPDNLSYQYTTVYGSEADEAAASVDVTITNAGIVLTEKEYPDTAFRAKIAELVDTNQNGLISKTEERGVTSLQISGAEIEDLTGIGRLINLTELNCSGNNLTAIDISNNSALVTLDCSANKIKELNTQNNPALKTLLCADNRIVRLNISNNALLENLEAGNNRLIAIDISGNSALDSLRGGNQTASIVKVPEEDRNFLNMKGYNEAFNHELVTGIVAYVDDTVVENAVVTMTENGIYVSADVNRLVYQYELPGFRSMSVTVKIVDEEELDEELRTNITTLSIAAFSDKIYTGEETTQVIVIYDGTYLLQENTDFTVRYENNVEVGTAVVTINGIGYYVGTYTGTYEIKAEWKDIAIKNIPNQTYQDKEIEPALSVKLGKKTLTKGSDYTVEYLNNKDTGVATVVITGAGQYAQSGIREVTFNIMECNISKVTFAPIEAQTYDGTAKEPVPMLSHVNELKAGRDYTVSYSKNIKAGKGVITFKGKGNYTGTVNKTFTIKKCNISQLTYEEISVDEKVPFCITGAKAAVNITFASGNSLTEGVDYTLSYSNNKKAGVKDAKVTIKGKGSCSGNKTITFEVEPQDIGDSSIQIQIPVSQKNSQGKAIKPKVTIKQNNKKLQEGENKDYTITFNAEETTRSGKVTVTITGKKNYSGETTADFVIVDKLITKAKIKGLKNFEYDGEEKEQSEENISVMLGREAVPTNCYRLTYNNNVNVSNKAVITASATPETCNYEYGGSVSAKFKITPIKFVVSKNEKRVAVQLADSLIVYNGEKQYPDVIVSDSKRDVVLKKDIDYKLTYSNNKSAGNKGKIKVKGTGNYSGTLTVSFSIAKKNMTEYEKDFSVILKNSAYTGKNLSPRLIVMHGDNVLKLNKDYKLRIERDQNPNEFNGKIKDKGGYTITVYGAGNYTGELSKYRLYVY